MMKTISQGVVMNGLSASAGLFMLAPGVTNASVWDVAARNFLLLAPLYVLSALALRRRERSVSCSSPLIGLLAIAVLDPLC
jgi:hypothetical protein